MKIDVMMPVIAIVSWCIILSIPICYCVKWEKEGKEIIKQETIAKNSELEKAKGRKAKWDKEFPGIPYLHFAKRIKNKIKYTKSINGDVDGDIVGITPVIIGDVKGTVSGLGDTFIIIADDNTFLEVSPVKYTITQIGNTVLSDKWRPCE